jgi:DNA-binding FrmR family transcriptional regulator
MPPLRKQQGEEGHIPVRRRRWRSKQRHCCLLWPWSHMRDEPLGDRESPRESNVKLADREAKAKLLRRVRRIEGQARGVARMIEEDRDCSEILQQLAAVRSAAHQATIALVRSYATECVVSDASAEEIADALAMALSRLA